MGITYLPSSINRCWHIITLLKEKRHFYIHDGRIILRHVEILLYLSIQM